MQKSKIKQIESCFVSWENKNVDRNSPHNSCSQPLSQKRITSIILSQTLSQAVTHSLILFTFIVILQSGFKDICRVGWHPWKYSCSGTSHHNSLLSHRTLIMSKVFLVHPLSVPIRLIVHCKCQDISQQKWYESPIYSFHSFIPPNISRYLKAAAVTLASHILRVQTISLHHYLELF